MSKVGLDKNLTLIGNITLMMSSQIPVIKNILSENIINLVDENPHNFRSHSKIFLNGEWLGMVEKPFAIVKDLRNKKINGEIESYVSIVHDIENKEIKIYCDGGRLTRILFRVENNTLMTDRSDIDDIKKLNIKSWNEFLIKKKGRFENVDVEEIKFMLIADNINTVEGMRLRMTNSVDMVKDVKEGLVVNRYDDYMYVKYTHCEIHPSFLLGIIATNIPFINHIYCD